MSRHDEALQRLTAFRITVPATTRERHLVEITDAAGFVNPDKTSGSPGPWFLCANKPTPMYFSQIAFAGTGLFDDIAIKAEGLSKEYYIGSVQDQKLTLQQRIARGL